MSARIIDFPGVPRHASAEQLIENAAQSQLAELVIIGYDRQGNLYMVGNLHDGPQVLFLLEQAKLQLLQSFMYEVEPDE